MLKVWNSEDRSLSLKEKEELVRSTKKVKNVSHVGFDEGHSSGPASPNRDGGLWNRYTSFRDKLLGEIPGAFAQAFSFKDGMDDDTESDGEVETLRQGLLVVKIPRELKQRIHKPWVSAFIVKVYGRSVGLNFIQARLLGLWKPVGRLDCVDLGHGFFLTRLSLGEDYENVLRKGLWFIEDHFLSIRPWEPDFKPALADVSSIAVWIRLNELPIEYYNAEALQLIGKAIGNVLQVDTFTALETRGRFARLCVQVDVEKPLATAIMIGRLEQQICYEGIQKMCFKCGRLGHRKSIALMCGEGTSGVLHDSEQSTEQAEVCEGVYGPWIVVARRKNRTKPLRSGGTSPRQSSGFNFKDNGNVEKESLVRADALHGPSREVKRKLSPSKFIDRAQITVVVQSQRILISQKFSSMKDKKGVACNGFIFGENSNAVGGSKSPYDMASQPKVSADMVGNLWQCSKLVASVEVAGGLPFSASMGSTVSFQDRDEGKANPIHEVIQVGNQVSDVGKADQNHEVVQFHLHGNTNGYSDSNGDIGVDGEVAILKSGVGRPCAMQCEVTGGDGDGGFAAHGYSVSRERSNERGVGVDSALKPSFKKRVGDLVQNHNPDILVVMETCVEGDKTREITNLLPFDGAIHTDTIGYAGGLWVLWNVDRVEIALLSRTEQEIHAEVKVRFTNVSWLLSAVYASPRNAERQVLWINLMSVANLHNMPWVIAGDFNEPLLSEDKFGSRALEDELLREMDLVLRQEEELWA
uniref:DUF4283 domain-containing protein n=1 Tax=Quercus lobata TaxID=97700 RepID=A0A7N2LFW7_QUELO